MNYTQRAWRDKHGLEASRRSQKHQKLLKRLYRQQAFEKHGNRCKRCGFSDTRALQFHHVHGDGMEHKKRYRFNYRYWQLVLNDTTNTWELLCANCHLIHHAEVSK